jgi:hypothetical protein
MIDRVNLTLLSSGFCCIPSKSSGLCSGSQLFEITFIFLGGGTEESGFHCAAQAGLKLTILLLQPPECWNYSRAPPHLTNFGSFFFFFCSARV